jgi:hypothetical protein
VDYYGLPGLRLGLSGYSGRTQAEDAVDDIPGADIGIQMIGLDARYIYRRFSARGQYIHAKLSDTNAYNILNDADLGAELKGWYAEAAFNILPLSKAQKLDVFVRHERYDTHAATKDAGISKNLAFDRMEWIGGLSFHMAPGAVVKADYQIIDNAIVNNNSKGQFNLGIGIWF